MNIMRHSQSLQLMHGSTCLVTSLSAQHGVLAEIHYQPAKYSVA